VVSTLNNYNKSPEVVLTCLRDGRGINIGRASFCASTSNVSKGGKVISGPEKKIAWLKSIYYNPSNLLFARDWSKRVT